MHVELGSALFPVQPGITLLEALARGSGRALETLNIEEYFQQRASPFRMQRFKNVMGCFKNLTTLSTNYNYVSDDIISSIASASGNTLKNLSIKVRYFSSIHHVYTIYI